MHDATLIRCQRRKKTVAKNTAAAVTSVSLAKLPSLEFAAYKQPNENSATTNAPMQSDLFRDSNCWRGKARCRTRPAIDATPTAKIARMETTYDQPVARANHIGIPREINQITPAKNKTTAIKMPSARRCQASRMRLATSSGAKKRKPAASHALPSSSG